VTAEGDEYSSAVRRLRIHVTELRDLCEESLGLQRMAEDNVNLLWSLLDAISNGLHEVDEHTIDEILKDITRERQITFDVIADQVKILSTYYYSDPTQAFEPWARYRAMLRRELDRLNAFIYGLPIATCIILTWLTTNIDLDVG
jgi:hypothetical protein